MCLHTSRKESFCKMVNTFVPFADVRKNAQTLDYRRLGKQRVEAYQIWRVLQGLTKGWVNHPAVLMWKGHTCALAMYCNGMIDEWVLRGYKNTMKKLPHCKTPRFPWWWGWEPIHKSHQSALNRKMPEFYNFDADPTHEYIWPSKIPLDTRTYFTLSSADVLRATILDAGESDHDRPSAVHDEAVKELSK